MLHRRLLLAATCLFLPAPAFALEPKDIFIITNKNLPESQQVALHYCQKRGVPKDHILSFDLPKGESISRQDFMHRLHDPLRQALEKHKKEVKVLLTVYGVPLRVGGSAPEPDEKEDLALVREDLKQQRTQIKQLQKKIAELQVKLKKKPDDSMKKKLAKMRKEQNAQQAKTKSLQMRERWLSHTESQACVDSELMLLWWGAYELRRWQPNLLNFRVPEIVRRKKPPVLMVSRLDGPSAKLAMRLVDDAVAMEKTGLRGKVYVDARGIGWNKKRDPGYGYGGYDESLREMAKLLQSKAKMDVTLDNKGGLFKPKSCPDTALYCGWYSLAKYVDCCQFTKGAVAYHIASSEAVTLRNPKARLWCPNILKNGACATLGPVAEPYTIGFPKPEEFFGYLVTGEYTLVECYSKTLLLNSWMTVLVGDPLYNPYKNNRRLKANQVRPSPEGCPFLFSIRRSKTK